MKELPKPRRDEAAKARHRKYMRDYMRRYRAPAVLDIDAGDEDYALDLGSFAPSSGKEHTR